MTPQKIRKAVFPAAGMGTRFLPATKATPKEMLCLVDKPLIQYGVEEAVAAGCTEIIIVTGRGKSTMEDHFDRSPELEASLAAKNKTALLEIARSVSKLAKITYTRQSEPLGLGHAVLQAKEIVGNEPFCVLLPDDIVDATVPCMKQMVEAFNETQSSILGSEIVEGAAISAYGCLDCTPDPKNPRLLAVKDMVEKPKPEEAPSPERHHRPLHPHAAHLRDDRDASRPAPVANSSSPTPSRPCCSTKRSTASATKASATTPATSWASSRPPSSLPSSATTSARPSATWLKNLPL